MISPIKLSLSLSLFWKGGQQLASWCSQNVDSNYFFGLTKMPSEHTTLALFFLWDSTSTNLLLHNSDTVCDLHFRGGVNYNYSINWFKGLQLWHFREWRRNLFCLSCELSFPFPFCHGGFSWTSFQRCFTNFLERPKAALSPLACSRMHLTWQGSCVGHWCEDAETWQRLWAYNVLVLRYQSVHVTNCDALLPSSVGGTLQLWTWSKWSSVSSVLSAVMHLAAVH